MSKKDSKSLSIDQYILDLVKSTDLETVEQLITQVQLKHFISKQEAIKHIINLENQGKITLKSPSVAVTSTLTNYLRTSHAHWYWITIVLAIITAMLVFIVPEEAYPTVYARYILGLIFILWMPGYTFIRALFPTKVPLETTSHELEIIECITLSIGMSLALVSLIGLILYYTPWGIRTTPITLSILVLTITLATATIIRDARKNTKRQNQNSRRFEKVNN